MTSYTRRSIARLLPIAFLAACATINTGADFEPGTRLDRYATYDWGGGDGLPVGDPRLENNPFFDSRVRAAVELELAAKGMKRATTSPDLLLHYHASIRQRVDVVQADEVRGYSFPRNPQNERMIEFDEGTLILDVAEAATKKILWRGWSQTDVGGLLNDPRQMEKRINESVRRMLRAFPRAEVAAGN